MKMPSREKIEAMDAEARGGMFLQYALHRDHNLGLGISEGIAKFWLFKSKGDEKSAAEIVVLLGIVMAHAMAEGKRLYMIEVDKEDALRAEADTLLARTLGQRPN